MDALYDFLPVPSANSEEKPPRLYPKIVSKGTVTFEKLTEKIANHSGLSKGTILAVMDEIEYWTSQLLSDGYRVQIGNIGTASVSLKANTEVYDPSDIHAQSIQFGKIRLTASKKFAKQCYGNVLRAPAGQKIQRNPKAYSEEERLNLLLSYLEAHAYITLKAYGELTGLPKTTAWRDLNKWVKADVIDIEGRAPHRVYVKHP
ncbi:MAG TPA: HU family DNA-binding protein [Candidatus Phocaeicola merdavium]|nr:HU family DNA-binding protein [Candidatus Phocaeicola merdavium]